MLFVLFNYRYNELVMKKIIILALCFVAFYKIVLFFNDKADESYFSQYYESNYSVSDEQPTWWQNAQKWVKSFYSNNTGEESLDAP